jgi:hypothetical protein
VSKIGLNTTLKSKQTMVESTACNIGLAIVGLTVVNKAFGILLGICAMLGGFFLNASLMPSFDI